MKRLTSSYSLVLIPLLASLSVTAHAATIYASDVLQVSPNISGSKTVTNFTFDGPGTKGNVLGNADDGGKTLELSYAAGGQTFLKLKMEQAFTIDGTAKRDLKIVNFSNVAENDKVAAAIWVVVDGIAYNVGSDEVTRDTSKGIAGVWDSPTGDGTSYRESGWVVFGGTKGGKIDLDRFFGKDGIYGEVENLAISEVYVSGYYESGTTEDNYDLDAVKAFNEATVIPIPAAFWLFLSGAAGLAALGRKRRSS